MSGGGKLRTRKVGKPPFERRPLGIEPHEAFASPGGSPGMGVR